MGDTVIARLRAQGDEVRVVEGDADRAERWRQLGALVAHGFSDDPDLVERAAQNCRTIVVFDVDDSRPGLLEAALEAARNTSIDRAILIAKDSSPRSLAMVRATGIDHVFLLARARRAILRRRGPGAALLAEAIDASDDLAGNPRLELELSDPRTARALGLHLDG